jgi:ABC-type ATPase involved in cell division
VEQYFHWDTERHIFMPADGPQADKPQRTGPSLQQIIGQVFQKRLSTEIPAVEFKKLVLEVSGESESKVKRMISEAVEFGYVRVSGERKAATYHRVDDPSTGETDEPIEP